MFPVSSSSRFYLYGAPTDMRRSFDGLCGIVTNHLKADPLSGTVYMFINRRCDRLKMLVWDKGGFWLFYKRLEAGSFQVPAQDKNEMDYQTLIMILDGIDYTNLKRKKRYKRHKKELL